MKTIITALTGIFLFLIGFSFVGNDSEGHNGRCTGSASCTACSNCSRCGHCSAGGTCGVCRGSSSGRNFYSSGNSSKSRTVSKKKKNTNSSYTTSSKGNSAYGFYSGSSVSKKKNPVYYYNSNSVLTEENYLYVIGNSINVRKGPGENYPVIEKVTKNQKLIFLSEDGNWLKIVVDATKTEGYVYAKLVR